MKPSPSVPLWPRIRRRSNDAWSLGKALVVYRPSKGVRSLLQDQATANVVALSLLKWDREWHLLKYYGFWQYSQQWWQQRKQQQGLTDKTETPTDKPSSSPSIARIPFVITTTMKQEMKTLGYTESHIKSYTPLQATLILQHSLAPPKDDDDDDDDDSNQQQHAQQLEVLEQDYQQARERQQEEQLKEQEKKELEQQQELAQTAEQCDTKQPSNDTSASTGGGTLFSSFSNYASSNQLHHESPTASNEPIQELKTVPAIIPETESSSFTNSELSNTDESTVASSSSSSATSNASSTTTSSGPPEMNESSDGQVWYQVVEVVEDADADQGQDEPVVVGLYLSETEAQEGMQIRQELEDERHARQQAKELEQKLQTSVDTMARPRLTTSSLRRNRRYEIRKVVR